MMEINSGIETTESWLDTDFYLLSNGTITLKCMYIINASGRKIIRIPGLTYALNNKDLKSLGWHIEKPETHYYLRTGLPSVFSGKNSKLASL